MDITKPPSCSISEWLSNQPLQAREFCQYNVKSFTEIPAEIGQFEQLKKILLSHCAIQTIHPNIGQLQQLRSLSLGANQLQALPKELAKLLDLEELVLNGNADLAKQDWSFLQALTQLRILNLANCGLTHLPEYIALLPNLQELYLAHNQLVALELDMQHLQQLRHLDVSDNALTRVVLKNAHCCKDLKILKLEHNKLKTIGDEICELAGLETLRLEHNKLKYLPEQLGKLSNLEYLDVMNNPLEKMPDTMGQLQKLYHLSMPQKEVLKFPLFLLSLPLLEELPARARSTDDLCRPKDLMKLRQAIEKQQISLDFGQFALDLLAERYEQARQYPNYLQYLLKARSLPNDRLDAQAVYELELLYKNNPIQEFRKGDEIVILGHIHYNLLDLKKRLKNLGIGYQTTISPKTTHLIVGRMPKNVEQLDLSKYILLTESSMVATLAKADKPYLLQADNQDSMENISAMLLSFDADSTELALQLLKTGGLPAPLLNELTLTYLYFDREHEWKLRDKIKKFLFQYASAALQSKLKNPKRPKFYFQRSNYPRHYTEPDADDFLDYYGTGCELDGVRLARFFWKNYEIGHTYLLDHLPNDECRTLLQEIIELDSEGKKHPCLFLDGDSTLSSCPDCLGDFPRLEELRLRVINLQAFPEMLTRLTSLRLLYLDWHHFKKIPDSLAKLQNLEELSLRGCDLQAFPKVVFQLPKLRLLDLAHNETMPNASRPTETEWKTKMPNCRLLLDNKGFRDE